MAFEANYNIFCQADLQCFPQNEHLQDWFGPNCIYAWLQTAAEALQSQHWFIRKVCKAWDGNRAWFFHPNTQFTAKLTPNLAKNGQYRGYSRSNNMCTRLQRAAEVFQRQNWFTIKNHSNWDGNCTWNFKSTTTFSAKLTPNFGQKWVAPWLIWPKWHVQMVADFFRSTPQSKLVHEKGLQSLGWELYIGFSSKHII